MVKKESLIRCARRALWAVCVFIICIGGSYFVADSQTYVNAIQGMAAHDAAATGNPLRMGGKASTGLPAAVANGDAVDAYFDLNGRQVVVLGSALQSLVDTVSIESSPTEGHLVHRFAANGMNVALTATVQVVKASAGRFYGAELHNTNTDARFVHFYDSSSVTVGTTAPLFTIEVPGGSATQPGMYPLRISDTPIAFGTAIRIAATTSEDHTVSTGPGTGFRAPSSTRCCWHSQSSD